MKAIISGATRGIGKAIAQNLAALDYDLVLLARTEADLQDLKAELSNGKITIDTISLDLSNEEELEGLQDHLQAQSNIDLLVNNLGSYLMDNPSNLKSSDLKVMLETNLYSAIGLTQLTLPLLEETTSPLIVNIGSVMSIQAEEIATSYSISKHAFKAWNDALREEVRPKNIKVTCIYPGAVNTSSWDGIAADKTAMIQAEDIAKMVVSIRQMNHSSLVEEVRMSPLNFNN